MSLIIVHDNVSTPLLGQDWLDLLQPSWSNNVLPVSSITAKFYYKRICQKTAFGKSRFDKDCTSKIKNFKTNIVVKENANPVFKKLTVFQFFLSKVNKKIYGRIHGGLWISILYSE